MQPCLVWNFLCLYRSVSPQTQRSASLCLPNAGITGMCNDIQHSGMYVSACAHCKHLCTEDKCQPWMLFLRSCPPCALRQIFHWDVQLTDQAGQQRAQRPACFCFLRLLRLQVALYVGAGDQAQVIYFQGKHFINGAIFPAHLVSVVKSVPLQWREVTGRAREKGQKHAGEQTMDWCGDLQERQAYKQSPELSD